MDYRHEYQAVPLTKTTKKRTKHSLIKHSLIVDPFICLSIHIFTCLLITLSTHTSIDFHPAVTHLSSVLTLHPSIYPLYKYLVCSMTYFSYYFSDIITKHQSTIIYSSTRTSKEKERLKQFLYVHKINN